MVNNLGNQRKKRLERPKSEINKEYKLYKVYKLYNDGWKDILQVPSKYPKDALVHALKRGYVVKSIVRCKEKEAGENYRVVDTTTQKIYKYKVDAQVGEGCRPMY